VETFRIEYLLYYAWLSFTPAIAVATVWWFPTWFEDFADCMKSVVFSGLAIVPGTVLWAEYTVRNAPAWFGNASAVAPYNCPSLMLACLNVPAIPLLLLSSAVTRPRSGVPRSMNIVQTAHLLGCLLSGYVAVRSAAAV
jgi:hypothetical protein